MSERAGGGGNALDPPEGLNRCVAGAVAPRAGFTGGAFALPTPGSDALIGEAPGCRGTVAGFDFAVVIAGGGADAFDGSPGAGRGSVRCGLLSGIVLLSGGEPPRP